MQPRSHEAAESKYVQFWLAETVLLQRTYVFRAASQKKGREGMAASLPGRLALAMPTCKAGDGGCEGVFLCLGCVPIALIGNKIEVLLHDQTQTQTQTQAQAQTQMLAHDTPPV